MKQTQTLITFICCASALAATSGCAERKTRLWIDPPPGMDVADRNTQKLYYQIEDSQAGKKESMAIPLQQMPENLVVEQKAGPRTESELALATQADRQISEGKIPDAASKNSKPTVSYLRGLAEVEGLYQKRQYSEALVHLAPLIEQYPKQSRLFAMQGTLYRRIGEKKLSLDAYNRAKKLDGASATLEDAVLRARDEAESGENL
jgi:hypothetical protein